MSKRLWIILTPMKSGFKYQFGFGKNSLNQMGDWSVLHFTCLSAINRPMKKVLGSVLLVLLLALACSAQTIPNPLINYNAFLDNAQRANALRESRRLTEDEFINKMAEPGVVIL